MFNNIFTSVKKTIIFCLVLALFLMVTLAIVLFTTTSVAYAQSVGEIDYEIDYVPVESVEVVAEKNANTIKPGETNTLGVNVNPWYAEATVKSVQFYICDDDELVTDNEFARIINGNVLNVNDNAVVGSTIEIVAVVDEVESAKCYFEVAKIPVEEVLFNDTSVTVEQGALYDLPINIIPSNASFRVANYSAVSGGEYFEYINENNQIKIKNFIGRQSAKVVLSAEVDDVTCENLIEISISVPLDKVSLSVDKTSIEAGEQVALFVGVGYSKAENYTYTIVSGNEFVESFSDDVLITKSNIYSVNPEIKLYATCENIKSEILTITILIPLQSVSIDGITEIYEGETYQFSAPNFNPLNTSDQRYKFELVSGTEYARITDAGLLKINNSLDNSNITIKVKAVAIGYGVSSEELLISVLIPVKSITLTTSKFKLISTSSNGDSLTLNCKYNSLATRQESVFVIETGSELIESILDNQLVIGENSTGGIITLYAKNGDVKSNIISIEVYVPVETITFTVSELNRGETTDITPQFNENASDKRWEITSFSPSNITIENGFISIPNNMTYGTPITISYKASEAEGITGSKTFTVAKLTGEFTIEYSQDSKGHIIDNDNPQLETKRSASIIPKYNGMSLPKGLTPIIESVTNAKVNGLTLTAHDVAGDSRISYTLKIYDGSTSYTFYPTIRVFRRLTGQPGISNTIIYNQETNLIKTAGSLDTLASGYSLNNIKFVKQAGANYSLSETGLLTIKTTNVNPTVQLTTTQYYNGEILPYTFDAISIPLKKYKFYQYDGVQNYPVTEIKVVNGLTSNLPTLTRNGYNFGGYYESSSSSLLWDEKGNRTSVSFNSYSTTLYAKWTAVSFTLVKYQLFNDEVKNETTSTTSYGAYHGWDKGDNPDWTFDGWHLSDELSEREVESGDSYVLKDYYVSEGGTVKVYSKYTKQSCVTSGTLITLADGTQKAVEDLEGSEKLLVWNMWTGKFDSAPIIFIDSESSNTYNIINLSFSDGSVTQIITEHGFWDYDLNKYVYIREDNATNYLGHSFAKETLNEKGERVLTQVKLLNVEFKKEENMAWSPVTCGHLCYFVNGMLSMPGATEGLVNIFNVNPETMQYDELQMKLDILNYGLFTYDDFLEVPHEIFDAFGGAYLKIAIGKGLIDLESINKLIEHYAGFLG